MNEKNPEQSTSLDLYFSGSGRQDSIIGKVGWFCTYAPEEIILAGGLGPVRLIGEKRLIRSESYFPINFCPYLKSGWESLLKYGGSLSAVIFTNSCDGMRRLYDVAEHYLQGTPVFMLDVPRNNDPEAQGFFSLQLEKMLSFMEKIRGSSIGDDQILDAIDMCNRKRAKLKGFSRSFFKGDWKIDPSDYYRVMELSATTETGRFLDSLEAFTSHLPGDGKALDKTGPRVMIVGNFIIEEGLWNLLSGLDMRIVADDLCITNRYYEGAIEVDGSRGRKKILESIAKRYLDKPACMRMADMGKKMMDIRKTVRDNKVDGIIFISLKFCDTMLYSFPLLRKEMAELKVPVLYLEMEYNNFSEGQVKTRMQAFLEML